LQPTSNKESGFFTPELMPHSAANTIHTKLFQPFAYYSDFQVNCSTANLLFNFSNIRHPHAVPLFLALTEPQSISMEKSCETSEEEL
jgi:hypothetical protein